MSSSSTNTDRSSQEAPLLLAVVSSHPPLLHQEELIAKTPYDVTAWVQYLDTIDEVLAGTEPSTKTTDMDTLRQVRDWIGRRAVHHLPKSYKLWKLHWEFCSYHQMGNLEKLWERALVTLLKFPRVWIEYLEFAHSTSSPDNNNNNNNKHNTTMGATKLRRLANRALEALPVMQHGKIWPVLLKYYQSTSTIYIPKETKLSFLRRYIQFNPLATKEVADFLANDLDHWGEAALLYVKLLNEPDTPAPTRHDLWMALAQIGTRHPLEQVGLDWDALVRGVLKNPKFLGEEMQGVVWNQLASSWIRRGEFQLARSVYEEAIESVSKVRDFTILLDAYLQFEEGLLEATMEAASPDDDDEDDGGEKDESPQGPDPDDWDLLLPTTGVDSADIGTSALTASNMSDLELAMARAEDLTARRPILLNRVLLRQNPHDVGEWLKRAKLYKENNNQLAQAAAALEEGLQTVHARRAVGGSPSQMVLQLVEIYETDMNDVGKARDLMDRICNDWIYEFKHADDFAECFAAYVELELRQEAWDRALEIIRSSVVVPPPRPGQPLPKMVKGLSKSLRLWDLLLDLEESLGTVQTTKDAYNGAIEQRVATAMHILNYASFLTENKYFEEAFTAYERGIEIFPFPGVKVIWKAYLESFLKRYGGQKVERSRDLFERCLEACPPEDCAEFYLMNGAFEEEHGLTKRALSVYRDMCQKVPPQDKYTAYQLFIAKTIKYQGQIATRDIYQAAIQDLPDTVAAQLCLDFAKMEISLQEIDRARAVFTYGAQMADPRRNEEYWKRWNDFEVEHGNEETFREMLRIKRSVEASFSTVNYNAAEMSQTASMVDTLSNEEAMKMIAEREGVELEPEMNTTAVAGFVSAKRTAATAQLEDVEERVAKLRRATAADGGAEDALPAAPAQETNDDDDEIDIDNLDDDDDDEDNDDNGGDEENDNDGNEATKEDFKNVSTKQVPAAVFGGLANLAEGETKKQ